MFLLLSLPNHWESFWVPINTVDGIQLFVQKCRNNGISNVDQNKRPVL